MKRVVGVVVALVLVAGVAVVVWRSCCGGGGGGPAPVVSTLHGVIGSEKAEFFRDPGVQQALAAKGLKVDVTSAGSLEMSDQSVRGNDFAFPSSSVVANDIKGLNPVPVRPFYSPLVIVAHSSTAQLLLQNGLAAESPSGVWTFKMSGYLAALARQTTWQSLQGASSDPALTGRLYITTTDPASSSSGAIYLAVMSYLQNGGTVVSDQAGVTRSSALMRSVTELQGAQLPSSDGPFRNFVSGVGNPLVWVYESQVASEALKGTLPADTVLLYPDTTFLSDHTVVELTPGASALAVALRDDPKLQGLEARLGFRPAGNPQAFAQAMASAKTKGFAPDLSAAGVAQVAIPATPVMRQLVAAAEGSG
ncbi:hypothetical protein P3T36_005103 [Kitasatospora sp. MAP12-15]|uniref:hypothetical protein n=1 Tax=unclassified Kitasatospora TaxID=2633591 RepID=UPI00247548F0|nr:hypothetical protein [Kitasatospora sp. MAP12-44]MDH6109933.1 hypothetical protein [Kitasatospora sp. MAP12-44]